MMYFLFAVGFAIWRVECERSLTNASYTIDDADIERVVT